METIKTEFVFVETKVEIVNTCGGQAFIDELKKLPIKIGMQNDGKIYAWVEPNPLVGGITKTDWFKSPFRPNETTSKLFLCVYFGSINTNGGCIFLDSNTIHLTEKAKDFLIQLQRYAKDKLIEYIKNN